uniref:Uncharacterized protein n=1 Tax=Trichobilharzia regenti TaxID=157069 RepID=A0AA85JQQ0_TRIRE|nr:unnamed protein product [Trichobilharzia regenti]
MHILYILVILQACVFVSIDCENSPVKDLADAVQRLGNEMQKRLDSFASLIENYGELMGPKLMTKSSKSG